MSASLFDPISLRGLTVPNRVWLSPMCMYACSGEDGLVGDFHIAHYGSMALGGAGLLVTEATAVVPEGRVTPQDAGLWDTSQIVPWRRVTDFVHEQGGTIAVQLSHAGRKGGKYRRLPGDGPGQGTIPLDRGGWQTVGSGSVAFGYLASPHPLSEEEVWDVVTSFATAAERAEAAGFDAVELHAAHGYLLHEFLSPLTNQRTDRWGGSADRRESLLQECVRAVREVWPDNKPLFVRLSVSDVAEGGAEAESSRELAGKLTKWGADLIDCSSGGLLPDVDYHAFPGYQVRGAAVVRESGVPVGAVGLITSAEQAQDILANEHADVVLLGRELLRDPHWPRRAAAALGEVSAVEPPARYHRAWA